MIAVIGKPHSLKDWVDQHEDYFINLNITRGTATHKDGTEYILVHSDNVDKLRGQFFTDLIMLDDIQAEDYFNHIRHTILRTTNTNPAELDKKISPWLKYKAASSPNVVASQMYKEYECRYIDYKCECGVESAMSNEAHSSWCPVHEKEEIVV